MNFKEEYIKAAEEFTPDRQTIDRMKENVLNMTRAKKAFPFRAVAAVGGTVAACAVITLAAARIAPKNASDNMFVANSNMATSSAASGMSGAADDVCADCAPEAAEDADGANIGTTAADTTAPEVGYDDVPICEKNDDAIADMPNAAPEFANPNHFSPPREYAVTTEAGSESYGNEDYPSSGAGPTEGIYDWVMTEDGPIEGTFDCVMTEEPNAIPAPEPNDEPESAGEDTLEAEGLPCTGVSVPFTGYTLTIAEDWSECTLSGDGETFTYKRSLQTDISSFANDTTILYIPLTNTTDNKTYTVALADDTVIIRNEDLEIVGLFI